MPYILLMKKEVCEHCGHEWVKRVKNPVVCPKCHRRYYGRKTIKKEKMFKKEENTNDIYGRRIRSLQKNFVYRKYTSY